MKHRPNPAALTLTQQFTAAVAALALGTAAAFGVNETIVPVATAVTQAPALAFFLNVGTLFAVAGGAAGYIEQGMRMANAARRQPWGGAPVPWWNRPLN